MKAKEVLERFPSAGMRVGGWVGGALVVASFVAVCVSAAGRFPEYGWFFLWVVFGVAGGLFACLISPGSRGGGIRWDGVCGFGAWAAFLGFAMQSPVNGSLLRWQGPEFSGGWEGAFVLGFGAAVCQTAGKAFFFFLLWRQMKKKDFSAIRVLSCGLFLGLGFGISEVFLLAEQVVLSRVPMSFLGAVGGGEERAVAVAFHVFSGGLIAASAYSKSVLPVLLVLVCHTALDGVAGLAGEGMTGFEKEAVFLSIVVVAGVGYRFFARGVVRAFG